MFRRELSTYQTKTYFLSKTSFIYYDENNQANLIIYQIKKYLLHFFEEHNCSINVYLISTSFSARNNNSPRFESSSTIPVTKIGPLLEIK